MNKFLNKTCPVCRQRIKESDEVVVCPECGTPHHRACYFVENKCALDYLHGSFEWNGSLPDEAEQTRQILKDGANGLDGQNEQDVQSQQLTENNQDELANRIYELINNVERTDLSSPPKFENELDEQVYKEVNEMLSPAMELLGSDVNPVFFEAMTRRMIDAKQGDDGVSMRELVYFTSTSFLHYQKCFSLCMLGINKPHINLAAALFYPINQFYRKMSGFAVAILMFILFSEGLPLLLHKYAVIGDGMLNTLLVAGGVLSVVFMIFLAMYNDIFYYKHCVRQIKRTRKRYNGKTDNIEYYHELTQCGRPSFLLALFGLLATVFVRVFIAVILTE